MKKNLKLIKEDKEREKNKNKFQKIYDKLKLSLDPIAEHSADGASPNVHSLLFDGKSSINTSSMLEATLEARLRELQ